MRLSRAILVTALIGAPHAARSQTGVPLGPEFRVNTYTTSFQAGPALAFDSAGNFVTVWFGDLQDGSGSGVFAQRFGSGGAPLGAEFRVNTFTFFTQDSPAVASDPGGNFVVVWGSVQDGWGKGVFGQRYAATGAPLGVEFRVSTFFTMDQTYPAVVTDAAGGFVVVWQSYSQDGSTTGVFGRRYSTAGVPLSAEFRINSHTTNDQSAPAAASDAAGNWVVAWESFGQDAPLSFGVFGQRFASSGLPLGPEFRINTYTTGWQAHASVASDPTGRFVVVWESAGQDAANYGVFAQRFSSSGAPAGPEFRVNTHVTSTERRPEVAMDSLGNFVVAWQSLGQDGSNFGVFAQRFAASGAPDGPEFRVNSFTTEIQGYGTVGADPAGNFVVVWDSVASQDGWADGVFAQRFGPIVPVALMRFGVE